MSARLVTSKFERQFEFSLLTSTRCSWVTLQTPRRSFNRIVSCRFQLFIEWIVILISRLIVLMNEFFVWWTFRVTYIWSDDFVVTLLHCLDSLSSHSFGMWLMGEFFNVSNCSAADFALDGWKWEIQCCSCWSFSCMERTISIQLHQTWSDDDVKSAKSVNQFSWLWMDF